MVKYPYLVIDYQMIIAKAVMIDKINHYGDDLFYEGD